MKKTYVILSFLLILIFTSCKSTYIQEITYLDYSKMTQKYGIQLTDASSVSYDYEGLGSILIEEKSGKMQTSFMDYRRGPAMYNNTPQGPAMYSTDRSGNPAYGNGQSIYNEPGAIRFASNGYIEATPEHALETAVKVARDKGATALINIKINFLMEKKRYVSTTVTGMAVKRIESQEPEF